MAQKHTRVTEEETNQSLVKNLQLRKCGSPPSTFEFENLEGEKRHFVKFMTAWRRGTDRQGLIDF